jgi:hypothetical protein
MQEVYWRCFGETFCGLYFFLRFFLSPATASALTLLPVSKCWFGGLNSQIVSVWYVLNRGYVEKLTFAIVVCPEKPGPKT